MKTRYIYILLFLFVSISTFAEENNNADDGVPFAWTSSDCAGVYTPAGTLIKYYVTSVQTDNHYATMESGFGLDDNTTYYAYTPYDKNNWDKSMTALPALYTGQKQVSNGDASHLYAYDYQIAQFTTATGSASIQFAHAGAVLHFSWQLPNDETVTSLTLKADDNVFTTEATMNLISQALSSTSTSNVMTLSLDNIVIEEGGTLDAYMAVAPAQLLNKVLTVSLTTASGNTLSAKLNGTNIVAGKCYPITISSYDTKVSQIENSKLKIENSNSKPRNLTTLQPHNLTTSTTSVVSVTVYSPDFTVDTDNIFTVEPLYKKGDVNKDGVVDVVDAVALNGYYLSNNISNLSKQICDVNEDGVIDVVDVVAIRSMYLYGK